jgi:hypothetical protein
MLTFNFLFPVTHKLPSLSRVGSGWSALTAEVIIAVLAIELNITAAG